MHATRRDLLVTGMAAAGLAVAARHAGAAADHAAAPPMPAPPATVRRGDMQFRPLGRTGVEVSIVGLGGFHIGIPPSEDEGVRLVRAAVDRGVTFMDNSWDYHRGGSEVRMGKALRDGYRQRVFLMTKIDGRTRDAAAKQIDESLRRLQTDHVDLLQHHEVIRLEDPDRIFAEGGAQEAVLAAQKAGKVRFVGFTGHKDPLVHLRMLDVAQRHGFRFDAVQMPVDPMDAHFRSFQHEVAPRLVAEGTAVLGMKSMGGGVLLKSGVVTPVECLRWAMSLPTATVITGIESEPVLDQACTVARDFTPLTAAERDAILTKTATAAADGRYELFKTTQHFDATAQHPEYLG
jgi:predicted aldo/keto reductase-like oxidoreductase